MILKELEESRIQDISATFFRRGLNESLVHKEDYFSRSGFYDDVLFLSNQLKGKEEIEEEKQDCDVEDEEEDMGPIVVGEMFLAVPGARRECVNLEDVNPIVVEELEILD